MRSVQSDPALAALLDRVLHHARAFGRTLPEIRFFILEGLEFASLLEKNVYPRSPTNIWEGKRMVNRRHRIETGQETTLYYEVVQTGNPSYAYLNSSNPPVTQASVMAHVVGHCEFSELNVLRDSNPERTEFVLHLVRKVDLARQQMGEKDYTAYWNACESAASLIAPNSQFNLDGSVLTETAMGHEYSLEEEPSRPTVQPVFETLDTLLHAGSSGGVFQRELTQRRRRETLSRRGFLLRAPCQDVFGFLRYHAPASVAERAILDYQYVARAPQDFVRRTQIMNEGWAMYWEKKLMTELFRERAVKGIIEYCRVFSGVCYPRPYFARNPYHLGYHLWRHIEELYRDGKVSLAYTTETDREVKEHWKVETGIDPVEALGHLVRTLTDYEFLRRFLSTSLIDELQLNRIDRGTAERLGVKPADVVRADERWVWLDPEPIREEMLRFYTHFYRPRIYVIDTDFRDGGLLLYHRDDGRALRPDWIKPTLRNLNAIWKAPVALLTKGSLHAWAAGRYREDSVTPWAFEEILDRMSKGERPFRSE
ncbi:MAG: SpoVR family protein [Deltaproteobacteria bacterium]|nr:SpoVR family protein [Deltaproteobacteria bacterium]